MSSTRPKGRRLAALHTGLSCTPRQVHNRILLEPHLEEQFLGGRVAAVQDHIRLGRCAGACRAAGAHFQAVVPPCTCSRVRIIVGNIIKVHGGLPAAQAAVAIAVQKSTAGTCWA